MAACVPASCAPPQSALPSPSAPSAPSSPLFPPSPLDAWLEAECGGDASLPFAQRLAQARLAALRATLCHAAAHSLHYKRSLAGFDLAHIDAAGLAALPFTTAQDIVHWQDFLCVSQGDVQRMVTLRTSGSTGQPKRLAFSPADLARTMSFFRAGMSQLVHRGERLLVLLPGAERPDGVADLLRQALASSGVCVLAGNPAATAASLKADLMQHRPHALVAAPHQLRALLALVQQDAVFARNIRREGACGIGGIQSSGDLLDEATRTALEQCLRCTVLDHFGMTETGYGGGVQCHARQGYHLRALDVWLEIVDPHTGAVLPDGVQGELVLTTLQREAMPLIRYRTGDAATLLTQPCLCGSPAPRLGAVAGRYVWEAGRRVVRAVPKGGS